MYFLIAAQAAVSFTQNLEDARANEKDTMVTFECETNEPFVKVKWLKNNMEIFSGDKYRMHSDRKVHFLSVLMIDMRDDAEFTCVVVDEDISTTAKLNVEGWSANFFRNDGQIGADHFHIQSHKSFKTYSISATVETVPHSASSHVGNPVKSGCVVVSEQPLNEDII